MRTLVAMHAVLIVRGGKVLFDDRPARGPAAGCECLPEPRCVAGPRRCTWRAAMLCWHRRSSYTIIRRLRPESPGDLFDGTEIDEIVDAANHDAYRGREGDGRGDRRPHTAAHAADRVAGSRATRRAARGRSAGANPRLHKRCAVHGTRLRSRQSQIVVLTTNWRRQSEASVSTTSSYGRATGCACGREWEATFSILP